MTDSASRPSQLLFVCLGNICRSPLAEGVFRHLVLEEHPGRHFEIDSAGTGAYHVGEPPDPRARMVADEHGVRLEGRARQVDPDDLHAFDCIVAMDRENLRNLLSLKEKHGGSASLVLLREFDPEADEADPEVPDPYYGGPGGFEEVFWMVQRSCRSLLHELG